MEAKFLERFVPIVTILMTFVAWLATAADYQDPHCGGKQVIVHLFEWKWTDIAKECERYLGPKGFCGVQVSPPNEHAVIQQNGQPWWERYQPVSYNLTSRSGNEDQFKDMVSRCKAVGVRIYVDAVINHMAGLGRAGFGSAGSQFNSDQRSFPGVPYSSRDFHTRSDCPSSSRNVDNYQDAKNIRDCYLVSLTDLKGSDDNVRQKIADYLNHLISLGVAGFRVDAAKHMWPIDIAGIQAKTNDLPEGGRPFFYLEVIDWNNEAVKADEYFNLGRVTEFRYAQKVKDGARDLSRLWNVFDPGWGMVPSDHALVFVDNHDTQRGSNALTYKNGEEYKRAVAFTLANDYGFVRVMSSYSFSANDQGPPHNADSTTKDVIIYSDGSCGNGWVCEHRWKPIGNMALFRNAVMGTPVGNWSFTDGVLSFNRGDKGFFSMGLTSYDVNVLTGLPQGVYCDLISECAQNITVDSSGHARIKPFNPQEPFVAFIREGGEAVQVPVIADADAPVVSDVDSPTPPASTAQPSTPEAEPEKPNAPTPTTDFRRTVIFIEKQTRPGQDLFIRGGIDHNHRQGCTSDPETSPCSIPIRHVQHDSSLYSQVNAWGSGDDFLDWQETPEPGQGTWRGRAAEGTPAIWTSDDLSNSAYNELNRWGDHYWLVDIEMDCSKTVNSFFEFKAVLSNKWEAILRSGSTNCTGNGASQPPYPTHNHFARCGYLNVFHFGTKNCEIETL